MCTKSGLADLFGKTWVYQGRSERVWVAHSRGMELQEKGAVNGVSYALVVTEEDGCVGERKGRKGREEGERSLSERGVIEVGG